MLDLLDVIRNLGKNENNYISDEELNIIRSHKEEAAAYFHEVLDRMCFEDKKVTLEDGQLLNDAMFGLFFLAEWKDTSAFAKVGEILSLLGEDDEKWLGDIITENLPYILYQMFNDDYLLLTQFLYNSRMTSFVRLSYAQIAIQKYLDKCISVDHLLSIMRHFDSIDEEDLNLDVITFICNYMSKAHVEEYMPDVRRWIDRGWVDPKVVGTYADHVDLFYDYRDHEIIRKDYSLKKEAGYWYRFENAEISTMNDAFKGIDDRLFIKKMQETAKNPYQGIGRNDLCPCGSGKKFKKCCLPLLDGMRSGQVEPPLIRNKKTKYYPSLSYDPVTGLSIAGFERKPGRVYLEDRYDKEAIMIDYYVYLARETLREKHFNEFSMNMSELKKLNERRKQTAEVYLKKAEELRERKMEQEQIKDLESFDRHYAIHFLSDEWG